MLRTPSQIINHKDIYMQTINYSYEDSEKALVMQSKSGNNVTTSLIVAEVFGRRHDNVLRDIETLSCSESFRLLNFEDTPYTHSQNGQTYKMYTMTKDGFSFLVMGYTGEKAGEFKEKFISEFNKRETMLTNDDYILMRSQQILQNRLEEAERKAQMLEYQNTLNTEQLKISAPKVQYYDQVLQSKSTYTTTQIAKELGMSAETLNKILKEKNIQYRQSGQWVLMAKFQNKGFTSTRTHTYTSATTGETGTSMLTVWTEKGREFIRTTIKSN